MFYFFKKRLWSHTCQEIRINCAKEDHDMRTFAEHCDNKKLKDMIDCIRGFLIPECEKILKKYEMVLINKIPQMKNAHDDHDRSLAKNALLEIAATGSIKCISCKLPHYEEVKLRRDENKQLTLIHFAKAYNKIAEEYKDLIKFESVIIPIFAENQLKLSSSLDLRV